MLADLSPFLLAGILLGILLLFMAIGAQVAVSLGAAALITLMLIGKTQQLGGITNVTFEMGTGFLLLAAPMFLLMGEFLLIGGVGADLYDACAKWLSRIPGGLAIASIVAGGIFGAMCGASAPGTATIGIVAIPEMRKRGYPRFLTLGSVGAAGGLSMLIPPSLLLIVYGAITQLSVGKLFMAGVFPGILLIIYYCIFIYVSSRLSKAPGLAPFSVPWTDRFRSLGPAWPAVFIIVLAMGSIYAGVATPTEAGALGAAGALLVAVFRKKLTRDNFLDSVSKATITAGLIYLIIVCAKFFSFAITSAQIPQALAGYMVAIEMSKYMIFATVFILILILGCFMGGVEIMLITLPVFLPMLTQAGFDPIWFAVVYVLNIETAVLTPPVGINLYVLQGIAPEYSLGDVARACMPFMWQEILAAVTLIFFPQIALWLPSMVA